MKLISLFLGMAWTVLLIEQSYATPVTFDTSALVGSPNGPFSLDFVFTDGGGAGDGNNTVTLSDFTFGGGSPGPVISTIGGVSGDLSSKVSLKDSSFFNLFASSFTPGSTLSFLVNPTTIIDTPTPDQLSLVLLQGNGLTVHTTDPSGVDSLLTVNINSAQPSVATFSLAVPEPSSLLLLATGLAVATSAMRTRWRRRKSS